MAVFHPLKHTLARRERGIAERKGKRQTEETVGGVLLLKHTPARLFPISRSLAAPLADIDKERSKSRLRLFTATLFFFLLFPRCSCAHISLYHTHADWVRLEQCAGDTARILPRLHRHQKKGLVVSFCHGLNLNSRPEGGVFDRRS